MRHEHLPIIDAPVVAALIRSPAMFHRRIGCCALVAAALCLFSSRTFAAFGFEDVAQRARTLASSGYKAPSVNLPPDLENLTYDQFRDIRFKPARMLWHASGLPFELAFFHQGLFFREPVKINELAPDGAHPIVFDPNLFDYGASKIDLKRARGLGFSGFRVHYAVNTPKYKDEVLVFLGASYFRGLGKGQHYGLSARGLAVDTGLASGEEFPRFVEFWIERPAPTANTLTIFALLDSRRMTGAYRFVVKPGVDTVMDVKARLFLRENVTKLGLAPLTSMFFFGENQRSTSEDYRPEVHDSDGLSIASGTGEWIWRPLVNPRRLLVTSFAVTNPVGFGLMQRDRTFDSYEDLEARYDLRPGGWVEAKGAWGPGKIELVEIPNPNETNDNIVAYWLPDKVPVPDAPYDLEYRVLWQKDTATRPPSSWVMQTRRGRGYVKDDDGSLGFVIDFDGPALRKLPPDARVEEVVSSDANAEIVEHFSRRNDATGGWRVSLRLRRINDDKPVELRAFLRNGINTLSETWSYILPQK
jgi:periplasmic glucans biosynthesis protein